jgi:hypothetical protein
MYEDQDGRFPDESPVEVRDLAVLRDCRRAPRGTASRSLHYPCCFRDGSEIRPRTTPGSAVSGTGMTVVAGPGGIRAPCWKRPAGFCARPEQRKRP